MSNSHLFAFALIASASVTAGLAHAAVQSGAPCPAVNTPPAIERIYGGEVREVFALPGPFQPGPSYVWTCQDGGRITYSFDGGATFQFADTPDSARNALLDIFFLDTTNGWATGKDGVLLRSSDSGQTWTALPVVEKSGEPALLWGVHFTSLLDGYLAGEKYFRWTNDGGQMWNTTALHLNASQMGGTNENSFDFYAIDTLKDGDAFVGLVTTEPYSHAGGHLFRTTDGANWILEKDGLEGLPFGYENWDVEFGSDATARNAEAYVVGGIDGQPPGRIFYSNDGGDTWTEEFHECLGGCTPPTCAPPAFAPCGEQHNTAFTTLYGVAGLANGVAVAAGYDDGVYVREVQLDGTGIWRDRSDQCEFTGPLIGAAAVGADEAWIGGTFGYFYGTDDGGQTFSSLDPDGGHSQRLHDAAFLDDENGWVVGQPGTIIKTENGGCDWFYQQANYCGIGPPAPLFAVDVANAQNAVAAGGAAQLYHLVNGGTPSETWMAAATQPGGTTYRDVDHLGTSEFWAVGNNKVVAQSLNGGVDWTAIDTTDLPTGMVIRGITLVNELHAFVVGAVNGNGVAYRLLDVTPPVWGDVTPFGGLAGVPLQAIDSRGININTTEVYAVGAGGTVLKWDRPTDIFVVVSAASALTTEELYSVALPPNSDEAFAGGNLGVLLHGESLGLAAETWSSPKSETSEDIRGLSFPLSPAVGYIVGQALGEPDRTNNQADAVILVRR